MGTEEVISRRNNTLSYRPVAMVQMKMMLPVTVHFV